MTDIIAPPTISAFPPAPQPTDTPTEFDAKAFAKVNADVAFVSQANALASNVFNNATAAFERTAIAQAAATAASGSASAAASSASGAAGSASAAASSATLAGTHASTATAALTAMQVMYLGSKAVNSHPTTDNMGNPLQAGALYTNVGTNAALNKRGWWWDGAAWQLAWGDITGVYMPTTGGTFTGHINVPANATGNQAPRANEVISRKVTQLLIDGTDLNSLPEENNFYAGQNLVNAPPSGDTWHYVQQTRFSSANYILQESFGVTADTPEYFRRKINGVWGIWRRVIDTLAFMERVKTAYTGSGAPTKSYVAVPAEGSIHHLIVEYNTQLSIAAPRNPGDQITVRLQFFGAAWPVTFAADIRLPFGVSLPVYTDGQILTITFVYTRAGYWDAFYAGVHAV